MAKYLDSTGLTYLWQKIKNAFATKSELETVDDKFANYVQTSKLGVANGVATLDSTGVVPASQLPSYVDDVIEGTYSAELNEFMVNDHAITGESGKIYVDTTTKKTYRYAGSSAGYVEISESIVTNDGSPTAYGTQSGEALAARVTSIEGSQVTGVKGNSETTYRKGEVNITPANIGLGNLTNNKQVKGLASGTTSGHIVTWGTDGYTVADSGFTIATSVPSGAVFTDTTYDLEASKSSTNGNVKIGLSGSDSTSDQVTVKGTGLIQVTSDANGVVSIATTATSNTGTVTKVSTGAGLTGGDVTTTGTIKAALVSETANSAAAGTGQLYAVEVDKNGKLAVSVPWTDNSVTAVGNHYTPTGGTDLAATQGTAAAAVAGTSYDVVTGVTIKRDAAGHITGLTTTRQKVVSNNPDSALSNSEIDAAIAAAA